MTSLWYDVKPGETENRFDNYTPDFDFNAMSKALSDIFGLKRAQLNKTAANTGNSMRGNAASRLASRGISGSMAEDQMSQIDNAVNKNLMDSLAEMNIGEAVSGQQLMEMENQRDLQLAQLAQSADFQKMAQQLQKYGLMGNLAGNQEQISSSQDARSGGFWDDMFGVIGTLGDIAGIPLSGGTSLLGTILGSGKKE